MKSSVYAGLGILVAGLGATALIIGAGSPSAATPTNIRSTTLVTVYGTSATLVTPTTVDVMLGVNTQASSAASALNSNNIAMTRIIDAIEKLGIHQTAIQTSGLNINPQYGQGNPPTVVGYQVSDNVTVDTSVALAGKVIDEGVAQGANQVNGINFTTPGMSAYNRAYLAALKNARSQAATMASAMGEKIRGIKSVTVQSNAGSSPIPFAVAASAPARTTVFPGQQQESVTLKVVYRLGP